MRTFHNSTFDSDQRALTAHPLTKIAPPENRHEEFDANPQSRSDLDFESPVLVEPTPTKPPFSRREPPSD
jgi:hypothetical protein